MGHRHDAVEALRAYVADLEPTIVDGADGRAGGADDGDIALSGRVLGAPHFGLLAGVAGVAIVGLIGAPAAFGILGEPVDASASMDDPSGAASVATSPIVPQAGAAAERAVYVLSAAGLTDAARVVSFAVATGLDTDADVSSAIVALLAAVEAAGDKAIDDLAVISATEVLVEATRPPGLTPDRRTPGLDADTFIPPGQDDTFIPPGQDDTFIPPGRNDRPKDVPAGPRDASGSDRTSR